MQSNDNSHSEDNCVKLHLLQQRVQVLEAALPRTEIGTLDVDGHREYHTEKKRGAEMMREYQEGVTKRLILGGVSLACTALGAGFADWAHIFEVVKGVLVP